MKNINVWRLVILVAVVWLSLLIAGVVLFCKSPDTPPLPAGPVPGTQTSLRV